MSKREIANIRSQIKSKEVLLDTLSGWLYRSIVNDELLRLQTRLDALTKEDTDADAQADLHYYKLGVEDG